MVEEALQGTNHFGVAHIRQEEEFSNLGDFCHAGNGEGVAAVLEFPGPSNPQTFPGATQGQKHKKKDK